MIVSVIIHSQITPMITDSDSIDVKHVYSKSSHVTHYTHKPAAHAQCKKAWAAVPLMTMTVKDQYRYNDDTDK